MLRSIKIKIDYTDRQTLSIGQDEDNRMLDPVRVAKGSDASLPPVEVIAKPSAA